MNTRSTDPLLAAEQRRPHVPASGSPRRLGRLSPKASRAASQGIAEVLAAGSMIAGYRIEWVLGSGGWGSVYLAHSPELPRLDALKILSSADGSDPEFRARLPAESACGELG